MLIVFTACQGPRESRNISLTTSRPINLLHKGDPNLAGVIIYKDDPVNMAGDPPRRLHDHPIGVVYYFWDDRYVHDVAYDKRGGIVRDSWFKRFTPTSKADWARVDFFNGSDPKFVRHSDPRKAR